MTVPRKALGHEGKRDKGLQIPQIRTYVPKLLTFTIHIMNQNSQRPLKAVFSVKAEKGNGQHLLDENKSKNGNYSRRIAVEYFSFFSDM